MGLHEFFHDVNDKVHSASGDVSNAIDSVFGKNIITETARKVDDFMRDTIDGAIDRISGVGHAEVVTSGPRLPTPTPQEVCARQDEFKGLGIDVKNRYGGMKSIFEACASGNKTDLGMALQAAGNDYIARNVPQYGQRLGR